MLSSSFSNSVSYDHKNESSHSIFGFWLYLMTDCMIFSSLFAVFAILGNQSAGGPTAKNLFDIPRVAFETLVLLTSSVSYGFAMICAQRRRKSIMFIWLILTFILGSLFIMIELNEFLSLISNGASPSRSAFLSSFFTLVGTHGLHVAVGLLWMITLFVQAIRRTELTDRDIRRLTCLGLFWHFLDIVWICVFSFVYLASII
ncbi:MAG: cytochrome o ubiquinol oxidase subunit III [Burkholderia sp.]|nr:cytochrome o ubiquinol oxidase subunit III [Burkholderia sp.]